MARLIPNPETDRALTDPTHVWLHPDGTTTPASDEEIDEYFGDDERTLA